jgi:DNA-binding Lrp family transcriptional regulator
MDGKDEKIIKALKEDSSLSVRMIARRTSIPMTTVHKRIKKLRAEGIIKRYTIELDNDKVGKKIGAYIMISVDLKLLKEKDRTQYVLAKEIERISGVEKADIVVGSTDMIAYVRVKDVRELDEMLLGKIQNIEGIINTETMIVIH